MVGETPRGRRPVGERRIVNNRMYVCAAASQISQEEEDERNTRADNKRKHATQWIISFVTVVHFTCSTGCSGFNQSCFAFQAVSCPNKNQTNKSAHAPYRR